MGDLKLESVRIAELILVFLGCVWLPRKSKKS